jgi:hypothetical protein
MNFTYTVHKPPDGNWGIIKSDNSWNGMVEMLAAQTADIGKHLIVNCFTIIYILRFNLAVCSFTVTLGRSSVILFSYPLTNVYHSVFIKNPVGNYNFGAYTDTLTYLSWIAIIIFCIAVPPVVFLLIRYLICFINHICIG